MIFKLTFQEDENRVDWYQAKNQLHLLQNYEKECDDFHDIKEVVEISDEEAKKIMLVNTDYDKENPDDMPKEFSLYDAVSGDDFLMVGSTEWVD